MIFFTILIANLLLFAQTSFGQNTSLTFACPSGFLSIACSLSIGAFMSNEPDITPSIQELDSGFFAI